MTVHLEPEIESQFDEAALQTGESKDSLVRQALLSYLEDLHDARIIEERLKNRIDRAVDTRELPENTDAAALAAFVMAVIQGLSTLARDGAKRKKLKWVADTAMRAWPE